MKSFVKRMAIIMILRVLQANVCGPYQLKLSFSDGTQKAVDVKVLLEGPVLEPLLDANEFARVRCASECGTVVWPNGADLAPEALYALPDFDNG